MAAASMTAAPAVTFFVAALAAEVSFGDFLQVPMAPGSLSERFRFIAPLLALMGSRLHVPQCVYRAFTGGRIFI